MSLRKFKKLIRYVKLQSKKDVELFSDDVIIVSYPKSGSTWLRFLIGNYLTENSVSFLNCKDIIPDIHSSELQFYRNVSSPRFIKSHFRYVPDYKNVIYLVRDGRDVAVSYYFHSKKFGKIDKEVSFGNFIENYFNKNRLDEFSPWGEHVNSWLDNRPSKFMIVSYEEIHKNPLLLLSKVFNFAGIRNFDEKIAISAIEASSFMNMRKIEENQHHIFDKTKNTESSIKLVRNGKSGAWQDWFNDKLLEKFMAKHGSAMRRLQYID